MTKTSLVSGLLVLAGSLAIGASLSLAQTPQAAPGSEPPAATAPGSTGQTAQSNDTPGAEDGEPAWPIFDDPEPGNGNDRADPAAAPEHPAQTLNSPAIPAAGSETAEPATASPVQGQPHSAQPATPLPAGNAAQAATPGEPVQPEQPGSAPTPAIAETVPPPTEPKDITLKVVTWGGAYAESQQRAYFQPFTERFSYRIEPMTYDGRLDTLQELISTQKISLVDVDSHIAKQACDAQLLEPLAAGILENGPDGSRAEEDFLPGAILPCAIASVAWSTVIVYDKNLKRKPETVQDFFNLRQVPGKRLLPKRPEYTLELALMADNVPPEELYATLATRDGQDRAFRTLGKIRDNIQWWDSPAEAFAQLREKDTSMGLVYNGRAFMAVVGAQQPLELLWDHPIYTYDHWAIPRGAEHAEAAKKFIRFSTSPGPLADQTRWMPYGPARRSAQLLVGKHAELDIDMKAFLPTTEAHFAEALEFDAAWWAANGAPLQERFQAWVEGREVVVHEVPTKGQRQ